MFFSSTIKFKPLLGVSLALTVSNLSLSAQQPDWKKVDIPQELTIRSASETATSIVKSLSMKDWKGISKHIHPWRGVRFSPFASIFTDRGIVVSRGEIVEFANSDEKVIWGEDEAQGNPIKLSMNGYYKKFLYRFDYNSGLINTRVGKSW